jgi:hypothetical protein
MDLCSPKNIDKRFQYYVKNWVTSETITVPPCCKVFRRNELYHYMGPQDTFGGNGCRELELSKERGCFWWVHTQQAGRLDIPCLSVSSDGIDNQGLPAIAKVRHIDNAKGGILAPVEYDRHWMPVAHAEASAVVWMDKKSECIWRGAPTGEQNSNNVRMGFCYKWHDQFDVGIVRTWNRWSASYLKPLLSVHEMLNYKYIISIPGNDKDSGLNWKLASNSLVLMAPPKIESWLMEGLLEPWVHYVPLAADYSDLDKIVEWCRNNDDKCQEIVQNANNFMKQFEDIEVEKKIFSMIKEHYVNTFTLV